MTFYDLEDKHFETWCEDTDVSNMAAHTKISIEYAISVLEGMKQEIGYGSIVKKIEELKSLIQ